MAEQRQEKVFPFITHVHYLHSVLSHSLIVTNLLFFAFMVYCAHVGICLHMYY